jgi:hypothetical protein
MPNEISSPVPPGNPGATAAKAAVANVAAALPPAKPGNAGAGVPASPKPPALFGGHKGGGKKRLDGLVAGSPEAREADLKKDRERKRLKNLEKKSADTAAPLPSLPAAPVSPAATAGPAALPAAVPVAGVAAVATLGASPLFVPWTERHVKPLADLAMRIVDRFRVGSLMKRVKKLNLTPPAEKEIERDLAWKEKALADFNQALTESAVTELNRRTVKGAEHSHWGRLAMCGGELYLAHTAALDRLEKLVLENGKTPGEDKKA